MLTEVTRQRFVREEFKLLTQQPKAGDKAVVIKTQLDFDPGNRALRWMVGFGAGKATAAVRMSATDPLIGKEVSSITGGDKLRMGIFGGDAERMLRSAVDGVASDLAGQLGEITDPADTAAPKQ